jgi:hypothetical protein
MSNKGHRSDTIAQEVTFPNAGPSARALVREAEARVEKLRGFVSRRLYAASIIGATEPVLEPVA